MKLNEIYAAGQLFLVGDMHPFCIAGVRGYFNSQVRLLVCVLLPVVASADRVFFCSLPSPCLQ